MEDMPRRRMFLGKRRLIEIVGGRLGYLDSFPGTLRSPVRIPEAAIRRIRWSRQSSGPQRPRAQNRKSRRDFLNTFETSFFSKNREGSGLAANRTFFGFSEDMEQPAPEEVGPPFLAGVINDPLNLELRGRMSYISFEAGVSRDCFKSILLPGEREGAWTAQGGMK